MKKFVLLGGIAATSFRHLCAAVPTEITGLVTDAGTVRDSVQDFAVVSLVFVILMGLAWKLTRKRGA